MSTNEEGVVEQYNTLKRPFATMKDPELWDKIHDSVEFGATHARRRKVVIKVRTIKHLRETLEEKYNTYLSRQCLFTYFQPHHQNTFAARRHHHYPAKVASIKVAKIFAEVFADELIIISQDDKVKIGLGIPAVGRTFKTIQSVNEPVTVEDHDFLTGSKMKLIPSIYLVINPADSSNTLRTGQLFIFIRPEYFIGTSSATHIVDLESTVKNENFSNTLKKENKVRPIWVLLVDGGPDENPKYMKNIIQYAHLFHSLDLDYLTVRTHASVEYVDQERNPFDEPEPSILWEWIEEHTQLCRYSLDIKKCKNREYCSEYRAPDAVILLDENNGFLPPTTKGKDGHFINPIHALQYHDKLKILEYNRYCRQFHTNYISICVMMYAANIF
ncbi:hypothetical protein GLOIN_2v1766467 [Rhizophagus irregularis DAOM 181602=DAOM 197198]|nr:hypothetical protein GLOIN_2v1766467 [Rhizophagus irregularis DAOM 181602=DAOM 197198]